MADNVYIGLSDTNNKSVLTRSTENLEHLAIRQDVPYDSDGVRVLYAG
jgi:hypothetical protein